MAFRIQVISKVLAAAALAAVFAACGSTPPCASNSDCPSGYACNTKLEVCVKKAPPDAGAPDSGMHPDYALSTEPASIEVVQGQSTNVQVKVVRLEGFDEAVAVTVSNAPAGVTAQPLTIAPGEVSGVLTISADTTAAVGSTQVSVDGDAGGMKRSAALTLNVSPSPTLTVDLKTPAQDVFTNGNVAVEVTVSGAVPEKVEVTKDGVVLTTLTAAPYQYAWDTTAVPEGSYTLSAKATLAGKTYAGPVRKVTVDRTAPAIVSRVPTQGATDVSVNSVITATFSEELDSASVGTSSVTITEGGVTNRTATVTLSSDGKTLTVVPSVKPVVPAAYSILFQNVKDKAGNVFSGPAWTYTYPAWLAVGAPLSAEPGNTKAERPQIKLDPSGNPVVAWIETDGSSKNVYVKRWNGTAWQPLGTTGRSHYPGVATNVNAFGLTLDGAGNPVLVWSETSGSTGGVFVEKWNSSSWAPIGASVAESVSDGWSSATSIGVDASGKPWVAWEHTDGNIDVSVASWTGSAWAMENIGPPLTGLGVGFRQFPTIMISPSGTVWLSLQGRHDTGQPYYVESVVVLQRGGVGWQAAGGMLNAPQRDIAYAPAMALNSAGYPAVSWADSLAGGTGDIFSASWNGVSWSSPEQVNTTSGGAAWASIATNGTNATAVSFIAPPSGAPLAVAAQKSSTSWSPLGVPFDADGNASTNVGRTAIAVDATGTALVAIEEGTTSAGDIYVRRFNR